MNSKKESNMTKIKWLEKQIIRFLKIFEKKVGLIDENAAHAEDQRLNQMDQFERFGLQIFKKDHLLQYINYLKGLQLELELGYFYGAKK